MLHAKLSGRVMSVGPGLEEVPHKVAHVEFTNGSSTSLIITSYEEIWSGGRKSATGLSFVVPAGATVER